MNLSKNVPLLLLATLTGCHIIVPYDPDQQDGGSLFGDGQQPGDIKFDGLNLEGPVTTLDGGGCSQGILHSDFATKPSGWLFKSHCKDSEVSMSDCGGPSCLSVADTYLNRSFTTKSVTQFTLGLRFKMRKAPTCETVLFRLGNALDLNDPKSDLDYGIRLAISPVTSTLDPALWVYTTGRITWGPSGLPMAKLKESTWYSVEVRGRAVSSWQIYLLDVVLSENGQAIFQRTNWISYQYFSTLWAYQFGSLTRDCCKPQIDFDWVCFVDKY